MSPRPRKRRNKLLSIIGSDVDHCFSPSFEESESSSDSNDTPSDTSTESNPIPIVPVITPKNIKDISQSQTQPQALQLQSQPRSP
jgi:hypothetical protein